MRPTTRDHIIKAMERLDQARGGPMETEREQDAHWLVHRAQGLLYRALLTLDAVDHSELVAAVREHHDALLKAGEGVYRAALRVVPREEYASDVLRANALEAAIEAYRVARDAHEAAAGSMLAGGRR